MNAAALLCACCLAASPVSGPDKPRLLVRELQAGGGVEPTVAVALTESVAIEVGRRGIFQVLSSKDIENLLGHERQRQVFGCTDDASSCLSELAGAIGARFVMTGSVTKLGTSYQLNLQTLDSQRAQPIGRATRIAADLSELRSQLPYAVAEATATPLPPPPSHVLSYSLLGAGALGVVSGSVLGIVSLTQEASVAQELNTGISRPSSLDTMPDYRARLGGIAAQKSWSLVGLGAGAALIAAGIWLIPLEPGGGKSVALVPGPQGAALVGTWP